MSELADAALLLLLLIGASAVGVVFRPLLSERHRTRETTDLIQLVVTMLVTFAALVLGLLTSSAKASFDSVDGDLRAYAIQLIQLDRSLRLYGGEIGPARALLHRYTAAAIASTWLGEARPADAPSPAQIPPAPAHSIESPTLGEWLAQIESDLRALDPPDRMHRRLSLTALNQFELLMRTRWRLIEEAHSSISQPFYIVLAFWLVVVFASFGLSAPRNALSYMTILLGALSIASVIYVILDLDTPFSGIFMVPSQPMRDALAEMSR
jgi:hypothetical protein